jgi:hypothetical protein
MIGDWGYDDSHAAQATVAAGMRKYAQGNRLRTQALLLLGDNTRRRPEIGPLADTV